MIEEIYVKDTSHGNQELFESGNIILNEISVSDIQSLNKKIINKY